MKTDALRLLAGGLTALVLTTAAPAYDYIKNNTTGLPIKWPDGPVGLRIMLGTTPTLTDGSNFNTSVQGSAQTWNALMGSIQFQTTLTTGAAVDHNRINEIAFASTIFGSAFESTTLAVTTTWRSGNDRTEGDIIFNSAKSWDSYLGPVHSGVSDIHRVALHELGHLLGLDHPDEASQVVSAIMNSHISNLDTLSMDDITGAQNLYGPPGAPANDSFANATAITNLTSSGSVTIAGYNTLATKETGEPNHADNNFGGHSVWWKWTAPANGSLVVDTGKVSGGKVDLSADKSSFFDTTLAVYTGTSVSALATIASNDDINPGVVQASTVTITPTGGTVYYFAVDGFDGETGGIRLNLAFTSSGGTLATITTQPVSVTTTAGTNASFSVAATAGNSTITYQWQFNGAAIAGATNAALVLNSVTSANAGNYTAVVTTVAGSVTSNIATLTVNAAVVTPPVVVTPPASSGGGGGGGAPSVWFLLALGAAGLARLSRRR